MLQAEAMYQALDLPSHTKMLVPEFYVRKIVCKLKRIETAFVLAVPNHKDATTCYK
jgi:hypothetical protein